MTKIESLSIGVADDTLLIKHVKKFNFYSASSYTVFFPSI